ncbi:HesA/MoeB/ThiF family protein [Parvularcula lutaonensis]|uniref:HesA/MoeB/ThiF family protein n=1 Tax=Parvularcula lutaonensis TaxID=491923 RepID=A0ABV7MA53_9PROT|nr:HesA/MoeB/ThiF family protein [Parvularcula lutaonensis]GGY47047.1 thiazole biosynthesis adenylyltransferase ThiF [Parvularcula lutaonensis]
MADLRHKHHLLLPEIGGQGQKKLAAAKVLVIGAGGLGCPILAYLAGAGIGTLTICDGDRVELSNLQRQTLYTEDDIGKPKAEAAALRLRAMNSDIAVRGCSEMFSFRNADELVESHDLIIEGIDRIAGRHLINRACLAGNKPLLSAAASRFEGQVALFRPGSEDDPCYACLVPETAEEDGLCDRDGVMGPVVGVVGSLAAGEAVKLLCGIDPPLTRAMLIADLKQGTVRRVTLQKDPACPVCG